MKLLVRQYAEADCQSLMSLFQDTVRRVNCRDYSQDQVIAWAPDDLDIGKWLQLFHGSRTIVAVDGERHVGYVTVKPRMYIDHFYVHADYQGRGIGRALMKDILDYANAENWSELTSEVSITARPFFESCCFTVLKQQTVLCRGVQFINYLMRRTIHAA